MLGGGSHAPLGCAGAAIASQDIIVAKEAAAKALEGLWMGLGRNETPPHWGKDAKELADGACTKPALPSFDGDLSQCMWNNVGGIVMDDEGWNQLGY